jgi:phosphoenolpyruvate-protein kinase (PTS system EI component)
MTVSERRLHGVAGADGIVVGPIHRLLDVEIPPGGEGGPAEQARARTAIQRVAALLGEASSRLRAAGRTDQAEIVETSQLMAEDPSLLAEVEALAASRPAITALLEATERQAALLAALADPYFAARAADVRRLGRQAARLANEPPTPRIPPTMGPLIPTARPPQAGEGETVIIVARELGPADLAAIELDGLAIGGIALAEGSVTSHAAIVVRSLGVPLVVGLGADLLAGPDGVTALLDGMSGELVISPGVEALEQVRTAISRHEQRLALLALSREDGAVTADGHPIRLLVNASTEREVLAGLAAGAEGVGLLRTELAFLDVARWPTVAQHEATLRPIFRHLAGRTVTVRTLDFGADKTPPFLRGRSERGVSLQLAEPGALEAQIQGLLRAGDGTGAGLRIMLPLVEQADQIDEARHVLQAAHRALGLDTPLPPLGAMVETRRAVEQIDAIAATADFLSIGTNDLVQDLLGLDRLTPVATVQAAADSRVLRAISTVVAAARHHHRAVEVCGEAAGDPRIAVLLIGLGVSELSIAPSRLDEVRAAVRASTLAGAARLAEAALTRDSAEAVLALLDRELAEMPRIQPTGLFSE